MQPGCRRLLLARLLALLALLLLIVGVHGRIGGGCGSHGLICSTTLNVVAENPNGCTGLPPPECPGCG
uniref:Uncharacterized protein n=1 Tax=Aegilops tauschii TaxID=37682 RepID=N1R026_AEGTA